MQWFQRLSINARYGLVYDVVGLGSLHELELSCSVFLCVLTAHVNSASYCQHGGR